MNNIIVNFCPTGMVPTTRHTPYVPVQVWQIVEEVHAAYELGITITHLHARNTDETPTHKKEVYRDIVEGIRKYCPELVICLSTSGRIAGDFEQRSEVIELQPDMCSLTLSSLNFMNQVSVNSPDMIIALAEKMKDYGVKLELECFHMGMINYGKYLIRKEVLEPPFYWNVLFGNIAGMQAELTQIGNAIREIKEDPSFHHFVALAGLGQDQLKINTIAIAAGYGVRVGLEDNIWFNKGRTQLAKNIDLLTRVHELMAMHEYTVMPSKEFGKKGFYNEHSVRV
ncbi:BKACE family enzyme [Lacibacter sp. H407]|uniref:3-keto-5-aminohexanoate cleavage protein n=1 Tax=Lacibacter sp. H407 TaxID=3133423 RepID=UPI0030BCD349